MQEFAFEDFAAAPPVTAPAAPGLPFGVAPLPGASAAGAVMDGLAQAQAEADAIREAAYAEGYAAGREEALAAATGAVRALCGATADSLRATAERAEHLVVDGVDLELALVQ